MKKFNYSYFFRSTTFKWTMCITKKIHAQLYVMRDFVESKANLTCPTQPDQSSRCVHNDLVKALLEGASSMSTWTRFVAAITFNVFFH